jgi:hypothetical protein
MIRNFASPVGSRAKTVTESFPNPIALRKAQEEVAELHRFQQLRQNLVGSVDCVR